VLKRLAADKFIVGLLLAGMMIIFVGCLTSQDQSEQKKAEATRVATIAPTALPAAPQIILEPQLATDFVKWWLTVGMDYQPNSAKKSHTEAFQWMTPEALATFQSNFWTPEIANGVLSGQTAAAYQPASVQAEAINPDGTVVVSTSGTLVVQSTAGPMSRQIAVDYLVRKDKGGLRISSLYNREAAQPVATVPSY
jgi:hypothetical protein